jgi:hypothetical protein
MIKAVAMLVIGTPRQRHNDIINIKNAEQKIFGFVDEYGNFYDRNEASTHAFKCKQIKEDKGCLISENLW